MFGLKFAPFVGKWLFNTVLPVRVEARGSQAPEYFEVAPL
jgi:hypothetical protein